MNRASFSQPNTSATVYWSLSGLVFAFIMLIAWAAGIKSWGAFFGLLIWALMCGRTVYAILKYNRYNPYRFQLFILLAVGTLLSVKFSSAQKIVEWTPQALSSVGPEMPICHIALASTLGNLILNSLRAVISSDWIGWGFYYYLGIAYLIFTLLLGTAWCSWACGYGAWDEAVSRLGAKKPKWKLPGNPKTWLYLSGSIFFTLVLLALLHREAVFCQWLCPFKLTEDLRSPVMSKQGLQIGLMIAVGLVFIIVLPILTGRRTFCTLICPFGAWQRWVGRLNPFKLAYDKTKCTACGLCIKACPMQALERDEENGLVIHAQCNFCGRCLDVCSAGALQFTWQEKSRTSDATGSFKNRVVFILTAVILTGVVGAAIWLKAGERLWEWGRMFCV
jgi:polyferredoxin